MAFSAFAMKHQIARGIRRYIELDRFIARSRERYVLCYHRVLPPEEARRDRVHSTMWTSPQTFEAQIQWMQQVGHIVHYERLLDPAAPRDRPLFTITFDDGWKDNYEYAFPILKKYSAPALIFLATGAIDSGELFWPEDLVTKTHRAVQAGKQAEVVAALPQLAGDVRAVKDPAAWT